MKTGLVGCGHIAHAHVRAIKKVRGVRIAGVCDIDGQAAEQFARQYSIPHWYSCLDDLIHEERPGALHILTPPQTHLETARTGLQGGCHLLIEKPLAMCKRESEEIATEARSAKLHVAVCHNYLNVPAYLKAGRLIDKGFVGKVVSAEVYWRGSSSAVGDRYESTEWVNKMPGGPFQEIAPHCVYMLSDVLGPLTFSSASVRTRDGELKALYESKSGLASMSISLRSNPVRKVLRIHGTEASLHVDLSTSTLIRLRAKRDSMQSRTTVNLHQAFQWAAETGMNIGRTILGRLPRGHESLIAGFYSSLARGEAPFPDIESGISTIAAIDPLWEALRR